MQPICLSAFFLIFVSTTNTYQELHAANANLPKFNNIQKDAHATPFTVSLTQQLNQGLDSLNVSCTITANGAFVANNTLKLQIALEEERSIEAPWLLALVRTRLAVKDLPTKWASQEMHALDFSAPIPRNIQDIHHLSMRASLLDSNPFTLIQSVLFPMNQDPIDLIAEGVQGLDFLHCDGPVEPILIFKNAGKEVLNTCKITYQFDHGPFQTLPWSGTLKPGHTTVVTLPPSKLNKGKHEFEFTLSDPNGQKELLRANNTWKISEFHVLESASAPLNINFQTASKSVNNTPYILRNLDPTESKWKIKNGINSDGKLGKALSINLTQAEPGTQNEFVLPITNIDKIDRPQLRFNYAYIQQNHGNDDQLEIMISTDCGMTWNSIWSKQGSRLATAIPNYGVFHVPNKKEWKQVSFDLYNLVNQPDILLKFELTSDAGNAFFLDDITIGSDTSSEKTEFLVSPNPCNGNPTFTINHATNEEYTLKVLNNTGQIVFIELIELNGSSFTETLNLTHLPNGVYPVILTSKKYPIGSPHQLVVQK